jgi:hypothetical protein
MKKERLMGEKYVGVCVSISHVIFGILVSSSFQKKLHNCVVTIGYGTNECCIATILHMDRGTPRQRKVK